MPRKARQHANSGIYHVMLRGIDRQQIFEDTEDCNEFLHILRKCKTLSGFDLYAYCLMGNHVHLLIKPTGESLETLFKRIAGRYVYYFNVKYQRVGHLFQDRFRSEPIEDDAYFLAVLRYIHQNPVRAGYCATPKEYSSSSYGAYLHGSKDIDTNFVFDILPREDFVAFHQYYPEETCLEITVPQRRAITDEQLKAYMVKYARCKTTTEFQALDRHKKEKYIKKLYDLGASIRQLNRLTGTPKGTIERYTKQ